MAHEDILAWVNRERVALGRPGLAELPRGIAGSARYCVIGRCFDGHACVQETVLDELHCIGAYRRLHRRLYHPEFVAAFIREFDAGMYPDLLVEETA